MIRTNSCSYWIWAFLGAAGLNGQGMSSDIFCSSLLIEHIEHIQQGIRENLHENSYCLSSNNTREKPLCFAALKGRFQSVQQMVNDSDLNIACEDGNRLVDTLFLQATSHDLAIAMLLIENGAPRPSQSIRNRIGETAFEKNRHLLTQKERRDQALWVLRLLNPEKELIKKSKLCKAIQDYHLTSVFIYSYYQGDPEDLACFKIPAIDDASDILLHTAATLPHVWLLRGLLDNPDLEIDSRTNRGYTPLLSAANQGYKKTVEFLLDHGAMPYNGYVPNDSNKVAGIRAMIAYHVFKHGHIQLLVRILNILACSTNPIALRELEKITQFIGYKYLASIGQDIYYEGPQLVPNVTYAELRHVYR